MVCRGADRDLLYHKNEFSLQVPEDQIRLPMQDVENNQPNISSVSHYETQSQYQPVYQENVSENLTQTEYAGKLSFIKYSADITDEEQVELIQKKIRTIFTFYASYGDRLNINNLKSSKFKRMMTDCGIADIVPK
jgi:hypothetical protein